MSEPSITINGTELNSAQAMAVRAAITSFYQEMGDADALGDDNMGRQLVAAYRARLDEVLRIVVRPRPAPLVRGDYHDGERG